MNRYDYKAEALKEGKVWTLNQHKQLVRLTQEKPNMWNGLKEAIYGYEMAIREKGWK